MVKDIAECYKRGQPVLVGTTSIENSELVSHLLNQQGIPHNVLNAKEHQREALIVAQAGKVGAITVATNMAGRGTDIVLGGNVKHQADAIRADENLSEEEKAARIAELENGWQEEHDKVMEAGGLHIIGTERHESRRIDNQLRGRAGRQGDPGSSRFYLSFEDPLLRLFALDRAAAILNRLAPERGVAIEAGMLTRQIEGAQRKVEGRNFDMRKQVLEYDDVANDQRKVIYFQRNDILSNPNISDLAKEFRRETIYSLVDNYMPADSMEEQWDLPALEAQLAGDFRLNVDIQGWLKEDNTLDNQDITQWREHLSAMDYLRQGIHLRGYAQKNPKQEYKREAFEMFQNLWSNIKHQIASLLISVQIQMNENVVEESEPGNLDNLNTHAFQADAPNMEEILSQSQSELVSEAFDPNDDENYTPEALTARGLIVHRNDPCPCGSGLRYKQCHGKLA